MTLIYSLIDLIKVTIKLVLFKIKYINKPLRLRVVEKKSRIAVIMGNGPSLNKDLQKILNYSKNDCDFYSVNFFVNTEAFQQIKPNYYFLADKLFWSKNLNENFDSLVNNTYDRLSKVNWGISILCPEEGFFFIKSRLSSNPNITFIKIPDKSINIKSERIYIHFLSKRYFSIPNVNSVITLIWYSIVCKYTEVNIFGLDFSGFKSIDVNQNTNEVNVSVKHFYKNSKAELNSSDKYKNQINKTVSQRLHQNYLGFYYMEILSKVAVCNGINIINRSSFSYVDSFKRPSN